jgi:hypothetical protein
MLDIEEKFQRQIDRLIIENWDIPVKEIIQKLEHTREFQYFFGPDNYVEEPGTFLPTPEQELTAYSAARKASLLKLNAEKCMTFSQTFAAQRANKRKNEEMELDIKASRIGRHVRDRTEKWVEKIEQVKSSKQQRLLK